METLPSPALLKNTITPNHRLSHLKAHLLRDVEPTQSTLPLSAYCFMIGFMFDYSVI